MFADETGFMLQPVVRRTWAPRGQTPIHYSWDRRERLSAISALAVSPQRRRLGLHFVLLDHNVVTDDFTAFAGALLRRLGRGIILVMDRLQVHRSAARRLQKRFPKRLHVEWLPPYAPELNPVEQVWGQTKHRDLANYIPDDIDELRGAVACSLRHTRGEQPLLRSFFKHAKLSL